MKKLLVLICSFFVSLSIFAATLNNNFTYPTDNDFCHSTLELHVPNSGTFNIKIDGRVFNDLRNGAVIGEIPTGKRFVKVVQFTNRNPRNRDKIIFFEGYMIFDECQDIMAAVAPNNEIYIKNIIDRRPSEVCSNLPVISLPNNQYIYHQQQQNNFSFCNACNAHHLGNACGGANNNNNYYPSNPNNNNYYPNNNQGNNFQPQAAIPSQAFDNLLSAIQNRPFDSSKMDVAILGIEQNYFTAQQVKQLTEQFAFDNSRLKIAKKAFHKVIDPQNYNTIFTVFSFDASVNELVEYMRNNP